MDVSSFCVGHRESVRVLPFSASTTVFDSLRGAATMSSLPSPSTSVISGAAANGEWATSAVHSFIRLYPHLQNIYTHIKIHKINKCT